MTDLGPGQWKTETLSDWTHQHSAWGGGQQPQSLPFLLRGGQAGQMLGSGVQQGILSNKGVIGLCHSKQFI